MGDGRLVLLCFYVSSRIATVADADASVMRRHPAGSRRGASRCRNALSMLEDAVPCVEKCVRGIKETCRCVRRLSDAVDAGSVALVSDGGARAPPHVLRRPPCSPAPLLLHPVLIH